MNEWMNKKQDKSLLQFLMPPPNNNFAINLFVDFRWKFDYEEFLIAILIRVWSEDVKSNAGKYNAEASYVLLTTT